MRRSRRGNWETRQHFVKRTEDGQDGICTKIGSCVYTPKRCYGARVALNLQWTAEKCFPPKALLLYRDQEWWERTGADEGLRKRNCEATVEYRHGTNVPMRRWESTIRGSLWSELEAGCHGQETEHNGTSLAGYLSPQY